MRPTLLKLSALLFATILFMACNNHTASGNGSIERVAGQDDKGNTLPADSVHVNDSAFTKPQ